MIQVFEYLNSGNNSWKTALSDQWNGQTFTPAITHTLHSVKLWLFHPGSYHTTDVVTVSIRATSAGLPTGADLCVGTVSGAMPAYSETGWDNTSYEFTFDTPILVTAGTKYAIVIRPDDVVYECAVAAGAYAGGVSFDDGDDTGATWHETSPMDMLFEEWGDGSPTVTTEPVSSIGKYTATGNGTITDNPGATVTTRGFAYMEGAGTPNKDDNLEVHEDGSFGLEAYDIQLTGLTPGALHSVRAYVTNTTGTGYGATVTFTALIPASYLEVLTGDLVDNTAGGTDASLYPVSTNVHYDHCQATDPHTAYMLKSLYDAYSILMATTDDTPVALTVNAQEVVGRLTGGTIDGIALGIADDNVVQIDDATVADNDYAKFTANGLEGQTYAQVKSDLTLNLVENTAHSTDTHTMTIDGVDVSAHAASKTAHGLVDATDPGGAALLHVMASVNGATAWSVQDIFDATNPAALGAAASPGTAVIAAHRDHVHLDPVVAHTALTTGVHGVGAGTIAKTADITATKLDDFATPDANTDLNANTTNHGLLLQAIAPAAGLMNFVGITNAETVYLNKPLFDTTNPAATGVAAPGTQLIAARRDHVHLDPVVAHAALTPVTGHAAIVDDSALTFGTGGTASLLWETADANANCLVLALPDGGATDVPVLVIGDQSVINKDLTHFNGITVPTLALENATEADYLRIDGSGLISTKTQNIVLNPNIGASSTYKLTLATSASIPTLYGTGAYLRVGDAATTSHSLASEDDLMVSGKLEVDGCTYLDNYLYMPNSGFIGANLQGLNFFNIWRGVFNDSSIDTGNTDNYYITLKGRDNGVNLSEIARIQGAADPYFQIGRDDTGVALNAVTDMLVLQAGGGANNAAANFGLGIAVQLSNAASEQEERASIDFVLADATNGSEDVNINVNMMAAGAAPALHTQLMGTGGLQMPQSTVETGSTTDRAGIYAIDLSAGNCTLGINTETAVATEAVASDKTLTVRINGASYKILLRAV